MIRVRSVFVCLLSLGCLQSPGQPPANQQGGAKTWIGRSQEIEEYLKTAECREILKGPDPRKAARCTFAPGGPIARMAWRSLPPGMYRGFWESYKNEIAAYELDKLLKLDMVPPAVDRQLQGIPGSGQQWVENVFGGEQIGSPDEAHRSHWENDLARMTMFDDLIGNRGRNRGNMLRDAAWNAILIDHSRAFGDEPELYSKLTRIDHGLWTSIESLTRAQLDSALKPWIGEDAIRAILERRDKMRAEVKLLSR